MINANRMVLKISAGKWHLSPKGNEYIIKIKSPRKFILSKEAWSESLLNDLVYANCSCVIRFLPRKLKSQQTKLIAQTRPLSGIIPKSDSSTETLSIKCVILKKTSTKFISGHNSFHRPTLEEQLSVKTLTMHSTAMFNCRSYGLKYYHWTIVKFE